MCKLVCYSFTPSGLDIWQTTSTQIRCVFRFYIACVEYRNYYLLVCFSMSERFIFINGQIWSWSHIGHKMLHGKQYAVVLELELGTVWCNVPMLYRLTFPSWLFYIFVCSLCQGISLSDHLMGRKVSERQFNKNKPLN